MFGQCTLLTLHCQLTSLQQGWGGNTPTKNCPACLNIPTHKFCFDCLLLFFYTTLDRVFNVKALYIIIYSVIVDSVSLELQPISWHFRNKVLALTHRLEMYYVTIQTYSIEMINGHVACMSLLRTPPSLPWALPSSLLSSLYPLPFLNPPLDPPPLLLSLSLLLCRLVAVCVCL